MGKKLKINKKKVSLLLAGFILTGSIGGVAYHFRGEDKDEVKVENEIGHENIFPGLNLSVDEEDFVMLDIGNHQDIGTYFQDKKMKYCNDNDISLGVVVTTDAKTESAIYDDVEYVKGILSKYKVDFPVYLDINSLMEEASLNTEMKTKIAKDFLEKCASNDIYVGVYGTDTNLCRFKKYCNISSYDAFLVMDDEKIKYDGVYSVVKDLEGNIKASFDLAKVINENGNNNSDNFVFDGSYVVKKGDQLIDIVLQSGMSEEELLRFNDLRKKDISEGTVIRFPSLVAPTIPSGEFEILNEPLVGADLSYAQGSNIDWNKMKENFQFLILKCSQGMELDSHFENNVKNSNLYGIPIGAYCYNAYNLTNTISIDDFRVREEKQADFVLSALKNKKIDYPVYLDVELASGGNWQEFYNSEYVEVMLDTWEMKMKQSGYIPGLYFNQSGLDFLQSQVNYDLSERFELWVAGGDQYTGESRDIEFKDVVASSVLSERPNVAIAQATDSAVNAGAGNGRGHLDINFSKKDYTTEIPLELPEDEKFALKEFERYPVKEIGITSLAALGIVGLGIIRHKVKSKK